MAKDNVTDGRHVISGTWRFIAKMERRYGRLRFAVGRDIPDERITAQVITFRRDHRSVDGIMLPYFTMTYVLAGRGEYRALHGRTQQLVPGALFNRPAHEPFTLSRMSRYPWAEFSIAMPGTFAQAFITISGMKERSVAIVLHPGFFDGISSVFRAMSRADAYASLSAVFDLAGRFDRTASSQKAPDDAIRRALVLMEKRVIRTDDDMHAVASAVGMSYERFRKAFAAYVGMPPREYRIRQRIRQAEDAIALGENISTVAESLGYPDYFTFAKQFRKFTGYTPAQYRKTV